jgi:DnaJ-class molecular chaperone
VTYTHYDYLDLAPGASTARIEAAYAAVLERFQYGATEAGQDLTGLVRMIHAAYEVLSRPDSRRSYDAQLAREAADADAELKTTLDAQPAEGARLVQDVPAALRSAITSLAA